MCLKGLTYAQKYASKPYKPIRLKNTLKSLSIRTKYMPKGLAKA